MKIMNNYPPKMIADSSDNGTGNNLLIKRFWQVAIVLSVAFALIMNFLVGSQVLDIPAIKDISDKYATLLTPATYAFSIWSIIYVLLAVFAIYQARDILKPDKHNDLPQHAGSWFVLANICNGLWTFIFVTEYIALSLVVILLLTGSLYRLIWKLKIGLGDPRMKTIICVWWPILIYTGWATVATVVNFASLLQSIDIILSPVVASGIIALLGIGLSWLLTTRSVRELVGASAWGICAVGMQQSDRLVSVAAYIVSFTLVLFIMVHGYKNLFLKQKSKS